MTADKEVDARGLNCPLPLLKAKQALNELVSGQILSVLATDASSQRDFRSFAKLSGNELVDEQEREGIFTYKIKKH